MKIPKPVAEVFGPKSHPNSIYSSKQRLRSLCIPNYINSSTRPKVLRLYRSLQRLAVKQMDPACRRFLVQEIWEKFAAKRYETSVEKIQHLILQGYKQEKTLRQAAEAKPAVKERNSVFEYCFERINIVEGDLKNIFHETSRLPRTPARDIVYMKRPTGIDTLNDYKSNLDRARKLLRTVLGVSEESNTTKGNTKDNKNKESTIVSFEARTKEQLPDYIIPDIYFRFVAALQNVSFVAHPAFTSFKLLPQLEGTATGKPFPKCREKNVIHDSIRNVLQLKINPFDDKVAKYIENAINAKFSLKTKDDAAAIDKDINGHQDWNSSWIKTFNSKSLRHYKRRLYDTTQRRYVVSYDELQNVKIKGLCVSKIKTVERSN